MALKMKQKYEMLDLSKLPDNLSSEFKGMKENTDDFDPEMVYIEAENFNLAWGIVQKNHPEAIKAKKAIKKAAPKKVAKAKPKKKVKIVAKKPIVKKVKKQIRRKSKQKPVNKVTECKKIIHDAGYTIKKSIVAKKKVTKRVKRSDNTIIKDDVSKAITTIAKDTVKTKESRAEYSESFKTLNSIKKLLANLFQGIDRIYADNDTGKLKKIESLLKDIS